MYLKSVEIENIRSISKLYWDLGDRPYAGWHVILGDNEAGKTSFLRAIAMALLGEVDAEFLVVDWASYIRGKQSAATCVVVLHRDPDFDLVKREPDPGESIYANGLDINRLDDGRAKPHAHGFGLFTRGPQESEGRHGYHSTFAYASEGWFAAAFGPFRRFMGGDKEEERRLASRPKSSRIMSLFMERVALSQPIDWLTDLRRDELEAGAPSPLLGQVSGFIRQKDFLPNGVRLGSITTKEVLFKDYQDAEIRIEDLSDGYRSVLCLTLELLRQLHAVYRHVKIFDDKGHHVVVPGVVLIDEVDLHLHPSWQKEIGPWFRKYFPNIQFIVTSHSPLVCQAAEHGSVFALPDPEKGGEGEFVEGAMLDRLLYGGILDAYSTQLFGSRVGRSDASQKKLERLSSLNLKAIHEGLSESEEAEQMRLKQTFASMPSVLPRISAEAAE